MRFTVYVPSAQDSYEHSLWEKAECYKFYVKNRREHCSMLEIMNLWLLVPLCEECAFDDPFPLTRPPDILPDNWKVDFMIHAGGQTLNKIEGELKQDPEYSLLCKKCQKALRPWRDDKLYVTSYHLEENYSIPLGTPGRKQPPKRLRNQIFFLYDKKCFGCNAISEELHIDHIFPQCCGGDSAFRNLQPLCSKCGNEKGDKKPEEVEVYSDIYFSPFPSDSYDGLFW